MSASRILITGSEGLIGQVVRAQLERAGYAVRGLDLGGRGPERGDVTEPGALAAALAGVRGVVHLAAVSRVVAAEADPAACWAVNVGGLERVLGALARSAPPPWLVFASSREVYGNPQVLPADESSPRHALNVYAASKIAGEDRVLAARARGQRAVVVRFSNVYGRTTDHGDRVVPAFARAAAEGGAIVVHGGEERLDFTQVDDVARAVLALVERLDANQDLPPVIQLVSGRSVSLLELAQLAAALSPGSPVLRRAPSALHARSFVGSPALAARALGWRAAVPLEDGLRRLVADFRAEAQAEPRAAVSRRSATTGEARAATDPTP